MQSQLKYLQGLWAKMNWNIKAFLRRRSTFWKENMWRCANVHKILPSSYFFFRQKNGSYFSPANIRHRRYVFPLFSTLLKLKILWSWIYSDFIISFLREIIYVLLVLSKKKVVDCKFSRETTCKKTLKDVNR